MSFIFIPTVRTLHQAELVLKHKNTYLRVNSSHMEVPELVEFIHQLVNKYPGQKIYVDLQGSKIRISRSQPNLILTKDQLVELTIKTPTKDTKSIHIGNPNTIKLLSQGTHVKIDDGRMEIVINYIKDSETAIATVLKGGELKPGKGFNLQPHPFIQNQLSERDAEIVEKLKDIKEVCFALSFVCVVEEIQDLKKRSNGKYVVAKIEREMDLERLKTISNQSDEIWICRGDMGVQLGFVGMAKFVREYTTFMKQLNCPSIMAGEVMEHLCDNIIPTRSEICYLGNLIADGYNGIVLSDETVFGKYPQQTMDFCYDFVQQYLN
ncbi:pyruvate kinase, putative [Entamoeba dispar SAW760]|uniref:Pyruvate kinase n=1 Tax=Entamoeba dispar (strain ATCC PRA-260 / SAW760) TaxID=370354 RepID=B0EQY8_ENTDS|nr:pyruvate kinase, putative [Entamoeba dispar SAW760]EDR23064.1 pyruvate kinase, putative [Entamoeba dispar SAW760]|eukprot:EDR23064.1 pyruvate kinase, putative [Entamoeba dispar SAW760]